jgi:signal transduction histidine kinase
VSATEAPARVGLVGAWQRTPLWLRLISAMLALVALGLALTGAFGTRLLRGYLVEQVDEQLREDVREPQNWVPALLAGELPMRPDGEGSALPIPYDVTFLDARGSVVGDSRPSPSGADLPSLTADETEDRGGRPFTVDAAEGSGSWRAIAVPVVFSGRSGTVVIATSLGEVDATVNRLVQIDLIVGALVLAGLAVVGMTVVRTALRPLSEIELTAAAIGRGELGRRVPDHHPGTEMGRLSRALNAMLEQVERAFGARAGSEARARRSEQRMRRFIADASHELRTPLTSIRGYAELYRQGAVTDPGEVATLLARIETEATRMGLLVDDLLTLARLDEQRPAEHAPVDLAELAGDAVEAARAAAPERVITLEVSDDDADEAAGRGIVVLGDDGRLRQVATNLLDNALAYSPADAPVTVRVGPHDREGRTWAALEVVDRGQGLTPDQADRVFERFYRTDAARSRASGGTGLGLSIVAAIVHTHAGTVEVDSAPGEGSTFRVLLPLAEPIPPAPPPAEAPADAPVVGRSAD